MNQSTEKLFREEVVKNNEKLEKPLEQKILAQLLECHICSIKRYKRDVMVKQVAGGNILSNLNPKITPTNQEEVRTIQDNELEMEEEDE